MGKRKMHSNVLCGQNHIIDNSFFGSIKHLCSASVYADIEDEVHDSEA